MTPTEEVRRRKMARAALALLAKASDVGVTRGDLFPQTVPPDKWQIRFLANLEAKSIIEQLPREKPTHPFRYVGFAEELLPLMKDDLQLNALLWPSSHPSLPSEGLATAPSRGLFGKGPVSKPMPTPAMIAPSDPLPAPRVWNFASAIFAGKESFGYRPMFQFKQRNTEAFFPCTACRHTLFTYTGKNTTFECSSCSWSHKATFDDNSMDEAVYRDTDSNLAYEAESKVEAKEEPAPVAEVRASRPDLEDPPDMSERELVEVAIKCMAATMESMADMRRQHAEETKMMRLAIDHLKSEIERSVKQSEEFARWMGVEQK